MMRASLAAMLRQPRLGTIAGMAAILLWSTTVALARSLSEQLGPITAAAAVHVVAGTLSVSVLLSSRDRMRQIGQLAWRYLLGCGSLFVLYMLVLFWGIGLAEDRGQVLEVGLLNYLWPALTILLSLVLLQKRAGWLLVPGTLLALLGEWLVLTRGAGVGWRSLVGNVAGNPAAYALGLAAACSWALYSNLTRRWAADARTGAVDVFLPATGLVLLAASLVADEPAAWTARSAVEAIGLGGITWLAYRLWDVAMRRGNVVLVAACSYLTPVLSTAASCLYLSVLPGARLWVGCALVVAGSAASWKAVSDRVERGMPAARAS